jgi:hypothetical protein
MIQNYENTNEDDAKVKLDAIKWKPKEKMKNIYLPSTKQTILAREDSRWRTITKLYG